MDGRRGKQFYHCVYVLISVFNLLDHSQESSLKHETVLVQEQVQNAAKHLLSIVEGKDKEVVGTKYSVLKEIIEKINNCGYFDSSSVSEPPQVIIHFNKNGKSFSSY